MSDYFEMLPVIEACALQARMRDLKSQRLDQMKSRTRRKAEPADRSGVLRNLGFDQNYVEIMRHG